VQGGTMTDLGTVKFDSSGAITSTTLPASATPTASLGQFQFSVPTTDGSSTPQALTLDLTGTTQYGGKDGVNNLAQDGYASGT
ncbi:flagellar basal body FlgE domain-containing protein, partial [Paraburkholderia sp. SIMBA_050]